MITNANTKSNGIRCIPIPLGAKFSGDQSDNLARLSFLLLMATAATKERRDYGFFIPFPSDRWRSKFGGGYDKVKKAARNHPDIFELNDRYSNRPGGYCQSIRLTDVFRTGACEMYELSRNYKPILSIDRARLDAPSKLLVSHFRQFWLPDEAPMFTNPWQAFCWGRISAGDFYGSRCDFGRFHSNFTAFKHRHLLQGNSELVAIDIASCQMYILGAVVRNAYGMSPPLQKWFDLCKSGEIYDYLGAILGKSRLEAKNGLIRCVFERSGMMTAMPEYIALEREFGPLAAFLKNEKINGHQAVAHKCQRMESSILISTVIPKLAKIPIITVHDEFIVEERHAEEVKYTISAEFRCHGMKPTFKIKGLV